ncbi:glycoside hydrolase N-terminal domain-containing protein [Acrocarpospora sp. B8E8]|uniref:glycosyl hydrolase family 95 catalytic domain-containing protein n=1 Tax=Acrocarpospora sp. B8E8 TaxID=3153572 RepID=UPI00325F2F7B
MISGVNGFTSATPADDWEHALITGNGRQGTLVYGGPHALALTFSHERLFLPLVPPLDPPNTARILPELRSLLYGGAYQQAADRVTALAIEENPDYTELRQINPLVPSATLTFHPLTSNSPYFRECDFTSGLVTQGWPGLTQEVFASRPDDVIAIRLTGDVSGILTLSPPGSTPIESTPTITGAFTLRLNTPIYQVECHVTAQGGHLWTTGTRLEIRSATSVTITARTTMATDPLLPSTPHPPARFDELLTRHAPIHGNLFHRSHLHLNPHQATARAEETDRSRPPQTIAKAEGTDADFFDRSRHLKATARAEEADGDLFDRSSHLQTTAKAEETHGDLFDLPRLRQITVNAERTLAQGGEQLIETLYAAGRYAIISSVGDLPPTLQGVWSGTCHPAWQSGYTIDGNLQSAVAALLSTGTPELLLPAFDLFDSFLPDFRANAHRLYGCRGILTPVHLSTHGRQNHFTPRWCQTFWTAGAAWLSRLYFDYYSHTLDTHFLRTRALPFMTEAATFYEGFLDPQGNFVPSYSPENAPPGETTQAAINATMDLAAVRDLLTNLRRVDPRPRWETLARRLPSYRIAPTGELAEWAWDIKDNHAHRHASHLYPFWYEADFHLAEAGAIAVQKRLAWWRSAESDEMAFGLVQIGLAAAGLGMTAEADEALTLLSTRYWRPNLVSTHNRDAIFNVDICGGTPALIAAMLLRSTHEGRIDLLPACPWPSGEVTGLLARAGIRLDRLAWSPKRIEATLTARETITAKVNGQEAHLPAGTPTDLHF